MNTKLLQIFIVSLILFPAISMAQDNERYKISFWFGFREIARDSMPDNDNLDIMNYIRTSSGSIDEEYAGIGVDFRLNQQWEFVLKVSTLSDLVPSHFDLNSTFAFSKHVGVSLGLFTYPVYIENYNFYHINNSPGFIGDMDPNYRWRIIHDMGIKGGAVFIYNYKRFSCLLRANTGFFSFSRFNETIAQKKINGNLKREFRYATEYSPALFFNPEMELALDCLKMGKINLGIQLKANAFIAKRSVNYIREIYYWTEENPSTENVTGQKHSFGKYDADLGIYCRF